jgi:hypothetical protein
VLRTAAVLVFADRVLGDDLSVCGAVVRVRAVRVRGAIRALAARVSSETPGVMRDALEADRRERRAARVHQRDDLRDLLGVQHAALADARDESARQ